MTQNHHDPVRDALREHNRRVDHACRSKLGIGVMVWRALDSLVSLGALGLAGMAISEGADPTIAFVIAAAVIQGPKVIEWWLVREDYVSYEETSLSESKDDE